MNHRRENYCEEETDLLMVIKLAWPATLLKNRLWHISCEFCEISENTFVHRTSLVAASDVCSLWDSLSLMGK